MEELKIKTIKSSSAKSSSIALSIFLFVWIGVAIYLSGLQIYLLDFTSFETFLLTLFSPYLGVLLAMLGIDIFLIGNIIKEHFHPKKYIAEITSIDLYQNNLYKVNLRLICEGDKEACYFNPDTVFALVKDISLLKTDTKYLASFRFATDSSGDVINYIYKYDETYDLIEREYPKTSLKPVLIMFALVFGGIGIHYLLVLLFKLINLFS